MRGDNGYEYCPRPSEVDQVKPGLYRKRIYRRGPWAPLRIWIERDYDENGHLASDETLFAEWAPRLHSVRFVPLDAYRLSPMGLHEVTKEEFEWLITLRTL